MIFSTYSFIFIFLPIVFASYSLALGFGKVTFSKIVLIVSSLIFYAYGSGDFFPFFVASVFFNYVVGTRLGKSVETDTALKRKAIFLTGILGNVALLGYYKYTDFVIFNLNFFLDYQIPYQNIVLPIGISFFTFQLVAYLVDSYRRQTTDYNVVNYLMFITFFPQLIVGPIVHHKDVVPQYEKLKRSLPNLENISKGLFLFSIGCSKKLLMADPLTNWAQKAFDNAQSLNMVESWIASISFTLSYYFDLSGYADMAIGLALMFGIVIPINFDSPYKARNFADYWRRWHITLSKFLSDYIFRSFYVKGKGTFNFYFAIFVTFLISGFWHGAGWTFVVWGIINGLFVIASHMMQRQGLALPFLLAWTMTFAGVMGTRILFVSDSFSDAAHVFSQLFAFKSSFSLVNEYVATTQLGYIFVGLILVLCFSNSGQILERFTPNKKYALITALLMTVSLFNMSYVRGFLYFQF